MTPPIGTMATDRLLDLFRDTSAAIAISHGDNKARLTRDADAQQAKLLRRAAW